MVYGSRGVGTGQKNAALGVAAQNTERLLVAVFLD
jgi:hypothetical protein